MKTNTQERLLSIIDQIEKEGSATLTRLTILKKWFNGHPKRIPAFAIFISNQVSDHKGSLDELTGELFDQSKEFLSSIDKDTLNFDRSLAESLHKNLKNFQNEYQNQKWGSVRIIKNSNILMIEQSLDILLYSVDSRDGYNLARTYCENYNSKYGNSLNGISVDRIHQIINFVKIIEEQENQV